MMPGEGEHTLFAELRRMSPKVTGSLLRMRQETYRDGAVPAKYKLLTAMAMSIALRCEPCIRAYVQMAHDTGISRQERLEFLEVAMTMQGCPGEEWALKAYAIHRDLTGTPIPGGEPCCIRQAFQERPVAASPDVAEESARHERQTELDRHDDQ